MCAFQGSSWTIGQQMPLYDTMTPGRRSQTLSGNVTVSSVHQVLEAAGAPHHDTLLRYFLAEGVACNHRCLWASAQPQAPGGAATWLPQQASARAPAQQVSTGI